jgi:hypothetical protein
MKILLEILGIVLIVIGLIFTAQSESFVGPQTSFMYSNPSWTINGLMIILVGIIVIVWILSLGSFIIQIQVTSK